MKYLMLILCMQFVFGTNKQISPDDNRPPSINQPMNKTEILALKAAQDKVNAAQSALEEANVNLLKEKDSIIEAHRTKETPSLFSCGTMQYTGSIVRNYVVWTLMIINCFSEPILSSPV